MSKFKPFWYQQNVFSIDYALLKQKGIRLIIFDLDNTIRKIDESKPSKEIQELFERLSKEFELIVASNSHQNRVNTFCKNLCCTSFPNMLKPTKKLFHKVLKKIKYENKEICLIGDQLLTDILVGNRLGLMTILVDPIGKKDLKITSVNRIFEKRIMRRIKIKRGEYYVQD